ncbi:MAG TPA: NlpC/P60 family protein [Thermoleophilia bacterium]
MTRLPHRSLVIIALALCAVASAAVAAPRARAQSYTDVPSSHWAHKAIEAVTERGPVGHKVLDDYGALFRPEQALTRELLARSLVLASGHFGEIVEPVAITDVVPGDRYYSVIQVALHHGYLSLDGNDAFRPHASVLASRAEVAIVRWLAERYSTCDWTLLTGLRPSSWMPNVGWKTGAPDRLPYVVASRQLQLRFNHSSAGDGHEVTPGDVIDRAEVAYMFWRAYAVGSEWMLYGLADYKSIVFPPLSSRQKEITSFALKLIGYPYIWGGEYPTTNSPYGYQAAGGFDCSGFVFYVMKMHFGYPITVNERGAHDMAARAKPRITRKQLQCGDLIFFGPKGPSSTVDSIYHAGLYLGNGWFIHSTGSTDGVTLSSLDSSSYYKTYFAWGRRVLKPSELLPTIAQAAPGAAVQAAPGTPLASVPAEPAAD